jgi:hypothetical protein
MDVDQLVELLFGGLSNWYMNAESRIVDQKVECVALPRLLKRLLYNVSEGREGLYVRCIEL